MSTNSSNKKGSHLLINSVAGVAIGAAIGGMTGAALTNKKSRVVIKDIARRLADFAIEAIDSTNIETEE